MLGTGRHREALLAAWRDVLDPGTGTDWALFSYEGMSNDLKFVSKGDGGLDELIDDLNSGKIMYAFLKVDVPDGSITKYVLINWQGEGAPTVRKGTCANHIKDVARLFPGFHLTMHARTEDDLDQKVILEKLAKAGSAFNFKSPRSEEIPPSGPVGTAYQKVNPGKEINSKERDQFWLKEEREEKNRVAAEKKRRDEEKRRAEDEARKRDELEAARRAKDEEKKSHVGPVSDVFRKQRSTEAEQLIGHSTSNARAVFEQNSMPLNLNNKTVIPEKPIRSSIVAQRINSLQQSSTPKPPSPSSPTTLIPVELNNQQATLKPSEPPCEPKTSPIRNIDKIAMSLENPVQIQYEPILDPAVDLSPSQEDTASFGFEEQKGYRDVDVQNVECEPMIKQNILEHDMFDANNSSSSNDNDDDDSDSKFSTIKRSPFSKGEVTRQDTVIENAKYKNGATLDDVSPEGMEDDGIYQDLDDDPGLTARALYDYQAADNTEITFDPGDIITHIEQIDEGWWQGLGPHGVFGLFPANYVELLPAIKPS